MQLLRNEMLNWETKKFSRELKLQNLAFLCEKKKKTIKWREYTKTGSKYRGIGIAVSGYPEKKMTQSRDDKLPNNILATQIFSLFLNSFTYENCARKYSKGTDIFFSYVNG